MGLMTPVLVAELNDQIAAQSHAKSRRDGKCYFGCDLSTVTFCQRVKRVVRNEIGLITEVEWESRRA